MNLLIRKFLRSYLSAYSGVSLLTKMLLLVAFVNAMGQMVMLFLSLYLTRQGMPIHSVGVILAAYGLGGVVGGYCGGVLSDKVGAIIVTVVALLATSLLFFGLIIATQIWWLSADIFLLGALSCAIRPAIILLLIEHIDAADRSRIFGLRRIVINVGMSLAAFIGGFIASTGFYSIFIFDGVAALVAALLVISCWPYYKTDQTTKVADEGDVQDKAIEKRLPKRFIILCGILFFNAVVTVQLRVTYPIYLKDYYELSLRAFSHLFAFSSFVIVLIEVPLLTWVKNCHQGFITGTGALLICFGLAMLPLGHTMSFAYFSAFIWTLGEILFFPTILSLMLSNVEDRRGHYMGIYQTMFSFSMLLGPVLGTSLYSFWHADMLWLVCGLIGIASLIGLILADSRNRAVHSFG